MKHIWTSLLIWTVAKQLKYTHILLVKGCTQLMPLIELIYYCPLILRTFYQYFFRSIIYKSNELFVRVTIRLTTKVKQNKSKFSKC